jgi:hypothetical protein
MSNTENYLLVALVGATINMVLSATVPCLLKKTDKTFLQHTKEIFRINRHAILTSSLIMGITIFLALLIVNDMNPSSMFEDDSELLFSIEDDFRVEVPRSCGRSNLNNLSKLNMVELLR